MTDRVRVPTSERELNDTLAELLRQADANGIDVEGGWDCPDDSAQPEWDVVVTNVGLRDE